MSDDTIYRQEAIKAVSDLYAIYGSEGEWVDRRDVFNALRKLLSAQLEDQDVARDIATTIENDKEQTDTSDANRGDIIYRRAAIDALIVRDPNCGIDGANVIKGLPSAQQKPLKYTGESICEYCRTTNCKGCMYEPMTTEEGK